jgi:hypothetical protein
MSLGAGAGATRSRGLTCGDATVKPAEVRRPPALARLRGHIPEGALFRPATRPLGMRPRRMPSVTDTQSLGIVQNVGGVTA